MRDFKLLYSKYYFGRDIFVVEDLSNQKSIMVYRSSGLSGTGHKDSIIPFMYLVSEKSFRYTPGYIHKAMYWDNGYVSHMKSFHGDPEIANYMELLKDFLKDTRLECDDIDNEDYTVQDILALAKQINTDIKEIFKEREMLDLKHDLINSKDNNEK